MPTTLGKTTPPGWTSPDHAKTQRDAARRRDQKNQSQRPIVHTVQVQHLHLAQFGLAGPTLALKVQGACHTLSATSLSEVALRRTCTESIRKKSTLKTALTKKKTKFALSTLGVIYFLIYLPNYRKKLLQRRPRQPLLPHPIMMLRSLRMMS